MSRPNINLKLNKENEKLLNTLFKNSLNQGKSQVADNYPKNTNNDNGPNEQDEANGRKLPVK